MATATRRWHHPEEEEPFFRLWLDSPWTWKTLSPGRKPLRPSTLAADLLEPLTSGTLTETSLTLSPADSSWVLITHSPREVGRSWPVRGPSEAQGQGQRVVTISRPTLNRGAKGQKKKPKLTALGGTGGRGAGGWGQASSCGKTEEMEVALCPPDGHARGQSFSTLAHNRAGLSKNKGG